MFGSLGPEKLIILAVLGLLILGPERLPGAIKSAMQWVRMARDYITGTTAKLREELGPEFDEIIGPINELSKLRGITPQSLISEHFLGGKTPKEYFLTEPDMAPAVADNDPAAAVKDAKTAAHPKDPAALVDAHVPPWDQDAT